MDEKEIKARVVHDLWDSEPARTCFANIEEYAEVIEETAVFQVKVLSEMLYEILYKPIEKALLKMLDWIGIK